MGIRDNFVSRFGRAALDRLTSSVTRVAGNEAGTMRPRVARLTSRKHGIRLTSPNLPDRVAQASLSRICRAAVAERLPGVPPRRVLREVRAAYGNPDIALVASALWGTEAAWEKIAEIVDEVRDDPRSDELVSDLYLGGQLWSFEGRGPLENWIRSLRLSREGGPRRDRRVPLKPLLEKIETPGNPVQRLVNRREGQRLRDIVRLLPRKLRRILYLRYWEDSSFQKIADDLDLPHRESARRLHSSAIGRLFRRYRNP